MNRPCTICGEWNHVSSQCRARAGGSKRVQSRGGTRNVYGISADQLVVESMVPISEPFLVVNSEPTSGIPEVNGVDVNDKVVKRLIYVKGLLTERNKSIEILIDTSLS